MMGNGPLGLIACVASTPKFTFDFTQLPLGSMSAAAFLTATGLTYACSTANVTCQTDATTIVSGIAANAACIGCLSSVQAERGLVLQPTTFNSLSATAPRDLTTAAGWMGGSGTVVLANQTAGPDGSVLASRSTTVSSGFTNFANLGVSPDVALSAWFKEAGGSNGAQISYPNGGANTGIAKAEALSSSIWERVLLQKPDGQAGTALTFSECRDFSGVGGQTARSRDVFVDFMQYEYFSKYMTEAMPVGNVPFSNRRLSHPNGAALATSQRLQLDVTFQPMFSSAMPVVFYDVSGTTWNNTSPYYLASWGTLSENFVLVNTANRIQVRMAAGLTYTSTLAMTFGQFDLVQVQVFVGAGVASVCQYRVFSGGVWGAWTNLTLATVPDSFAPGANPVGFFMNQPAAGNGATGQPPVRVQNITCW